MELLRACLESFATKDSKQALTTEDNMAYKINPDTCINCGACEPACPVQAISEKSDKRVIDPAKCIDCGACAGTCPVQAISQ